MSFSLTGLGAMTLFVEDLGAARTFYAEVFGLEVIFADEVSTAYQFGNTMINLLAVGEASELISPAAVGGPESGARAQLTVFVTDADATVAELTARGVTFLNGPIDRPWGQRTAAFSDPAGNVWEIAQTLSA